MRAEEIEELKRRLLEAEETIRAIRTGEVDALVVSNSGDDAAIFDIGGDSESYRSFMEVMQVGAAALDQGGRLLYANSNLAAVLQRPPNQIQGEKLADLLHGEAAAELERALQSTGSRLPSAQVSVANGQYMLAVKPLRLGTTQGYAVTLTDVTERVRAEAALQSERAARAVIASANEAVLVCDENGIITHANAAATSVYAGNPVGLAFADAVPLVFPGATGLFQADEMIATAVAGNAVRGIEATAPNAPGPKDYLVSAAPLQVGNDAISGCVVTMVDMSQRKAAEKQQVLLMRELDHRVKNTLALVLSIAGRTMHHEDTLEGFQRSFTGRIQALSATHNLLAENSWTDLTIADVVSGELAPYMTGSHERVVTRGLQVEVQPRAAIAFGLVVHELATNAAKYGALSVPRGSISVSVIDRTEGEDGALVVEWLESDGPPVLPPTRKGFGQSVISRSLQYTPGGGATLDYQPSGIRCLIRIPIVDVG
jgi:PAS domain S-box-containing protein